jgi:uncharacterized membrane protein
VLESGYLSGISPTWSYGTGGPLRLRASGSTASHRQDALLSSVHAADTVTVAWIVVGNVGDALNIGIATNLLKTGTYYLYERTWDHIAWGVSNPA